MSFEIANAVNKTGLKECEWKSKREIRDSSSEFVSSYKIEHFSATRNIY